MIHHMSFGARDPGRVAEVLAEILGATATRAPSPPFPYGSHLVCFGDAAGTFLEVLPATTAFDPEAKLGIRQRPAPSERGTAHVLVSSPLAEVEIERIAAREGWLMQAVETGLFRIVKVWVENSFLVELFAKGEAQRYIDTFGAEGMASLPEKLRELESSMSKAFASLPPEMVAEALGEPWS